jgi:hypothetical protein
MECLGINTHDGTVYEGRLNMGFRSQPPPILVPVTLPDAVKNETGFSSPIDGYAPALFREDSFDPVTKVRRGRVFRLRNTAQPMRWHVQDPFRSDLETENWGGRATQTIGVLFYERDNSFYGSTRAPVVVLGTEPFLTIWKTIGIEMSAHGSATLILRSHRSLDALPELNPANVPVRVQKTVTAAIEKVENSNHRLGAVEVVDRCRDALSVVFGELCDDPSLDLGSAIKKLESAAPKLFPLARWCGQIVARLHSRGKPNEQFNHGTRPVTEDDAQLALGCVALVLKEIGWAAA